MSVLTVANGQSVSRGYDYFLEKKVRYIEQMDETVIYGEISGSNGEVYHATVDVAHPRKSNVTVPMHLVGGSFANIWWRFISRRYLVRQTSMFGSWKHIGKNRSSARKNWKKCLSDMFTV